MHRHLLMCFVSCFPLDGQLIFPYLWIPSTLNIIYIIDTMDILENLRCRSDLIKTITMHTAGEVGS